MHLVTFCMIIGQFSIKLKQIIIQAFNDVGCLILLDNYVVVIVPLHWKSILISWMHTPVSMIVIWTTRLPERNIGYWHQVWKDQGTVVCLIMIWVTSIKPDWTYRVELGNPYTVCRLLGRSLSKFKLVT